MVHTQEVCIMDKKVVTLQDISCFGKCSLTVALPVISAMGISCSIVPTAVLSTHTGGFTGYTFRDLTEDIQKISDHWKTCGITFDGIYTGYLGSCHQVDVVSDFIAQNRREGALVFIDPAMADNGVLYSGFDSAFVDSMRELCREADIVVPNITEASMLLNTEYKQSGYDEEYIRGMLRGLCALGPRRALITGVSLDSAHQGVMAYDSVDGEFRSYYSENIPDSFHGTGDVFAAVLFGALVLGKDIAAAMKLAVDFTVASIKATVGDSGHRYGVKFEKALPGLMRSLES